MFNRLARPPFNISIPNGDLTCFGRTKFGCTGHVFAVNVGRIRKVALEKLLLYLLQVLPRVGFRLKAPNQNSGGTSRLLDAELRAKVLSLQKPLVATDHAHIAQPVAGRARCIGVSWGDRGMGPADI